MPLAYALSSGIYFAKKPNRHATLKLSSDWLASVIQVCNTCYIGAGKPARTRKRKQMTKATELLELEELTANSSFTFEITRLGNHLFQLQLWDEGILVWDSRYTSIKRACKDITDEIKTNFSAWV
jgi:hypothetical protein